jgi:hypothetical protein
MPFQLKICHLVIGEFTKSAECLRPFAGSTRRFIRIFFKKQVGIKPRCPLYLLTAKVTNTGFYSTQ